MFEKKFSFLLPRFVTLLVGQRDPIRRADKFSTSPYASQSVTLDKSIRDPEDLTICGKVAVATRPHYGPNIEPHYRFYIEPVLSRAGAKAGSY
jgi:hypothetical protein